MGRGWYFMCFTILVLAAVGVAIGGWLVVDGYSDMFVACGLFIAGWNAYMGARIAIAMWEEWRR